MKFTLTVLSPQDRFQHKVRSGDTLTLFNHGKDKAEVMLIFHKKKLFRRQRLNVIIHPCKIKEYQKMGKK